MFQNIFNTSKKYRGIYVEPPWKYSGKYYQRKNFISLEDNYYSTLSVNDLKSLPVKDLALDDSVCFMWVTDSHLKVGIEIMESLGFEYKTIAFNWIKHYETGNICYNFAPWTLKSWEICLLGVRGTMSKYKKANNVKGLLNEVRTIHSKKPIETAKRIDELFGSEPKIELFARDYKEGWDCWGNEVF